MFNLIGKLFGKKSIQEVVVPNRKVKGYILTCDDITYSQKNLAFRSYSVRTIEQLEALERDLRSQVRYTNFRTETLYK